MRYILFLTFCFLVLKAAAQKRDPDTPSQKFLAAAFYYKPFFIENDRSLQCRATVALIKRNRLFFGPLVDVSFYKNERLGVISSNQVLAGPFFRYNFKSKKVTPFIEGSIAYGLSVQKYVGIPTIKRQPLEVSAVPGFSVRLNQNWFIDVQVKASIDFNQYVNDPPKIIAFIPMAGLRYFFTQ